MAGKTNYSIEQAAEIMQHVIANAVEGGSFRSFIYDRLGFDVDAYVPLYNAGVMNFTNFCPVNLEAEVPDTFIWAGAHTVMSINNDGIEYKYVDSFNGRLSTRTAELWPGQDAFEVGEVCLVVYFSTESSGRVFALKSDKHQHHGAHLLSGKE